MINIYRYSCLFVVTILWLTSCQNKLEMFDSNARDGYLNIAGVEIGRDEPKSRTSGEDLAKADTVWLDNEVFVTAEVSDQEVRSEVITRGAPLQSITGIKDMRLLVFDTGQLDYTESTTMTREFKVTCGQEYKLERDYNWPNGTPNKHTLFLFAPNPDNANGLALMSDKKNLIYQMNEDVTKQPDFLISDIKQNKNLNVVNSLGSKNNLQKFYLKHALTAIGFEAVGWDLRITEVQLSNVNTAGMVNLESREWSSIQTPAPRKAGMKSNWMKSNNKSEWVSVTNDNGYLMTIPQTIDDNAYLTFKYEGRGMQPASGSYSVKLKDIGVQWTAGKKVIYRLRLKTRPAVIPDNHRIEDFRGGFASSKILGISAANDDNLTFTWTSPWLRANRGSAGAVDIAGGLNSGFVTGVNNWNNIRFFSTTENLSAVTERSATVTVTGKKSGTRTFTVTQARKDFEIEGSVSSRLAFRQGNGNILTYWLTNSVPLSEAKISISISAKGHGGGQYDQNWLNSPQRRGVLNQQERVGFSYKWNIQARQPRTATITITASFAGITRTKSFSVIQNASNFWIMLHDNGSFRMGIFATNTGNNFGKEEWRCSNGRYGDRMLRTGDREHIAAERWVRSHWIRRANFSDGLYWSSTHRSDVFWTGRAEIFSVSGTTFSYNGVYLRTVGRTIRCLYTNLSQIY